MEDGKGGVLVRGLEEEIVTSANEIFTLLERGSAKRRTAETLLNKQSSRSHSLFTITIHIKEATPEGEELIKCGKLNLVDLAGSENISRSGAREGRAREAGEINKSLLTLGRVITALVEHLGHIPYRDSKLTRLLRDSLGGRTKTCIIATVSPSVHCLEETLSTLDYAHRAKHIKNRPEVNQKMMKSTLIKDLYGEIDRLKAEVYAAREKNGVYIPKERYYQEERERKAMAEQIEQMGTMLEINQKQLEELQYKYDSQVEQSSDLSNKLLCTRQSLEDTNKFLATAKEDLKKSKYALKEKDYIISEQRKAENALAHQASVLQSDLEKSMKDNAMLFSKIAREDTLNAENRSVVNDFQSEFSKQITVLCDTVSASMARQNEHLQSVEKFCHSCLAFYDESVLELKKKVASSKALYVSHIEAMQNVVRLHNAGNKAKLEELSSLASATSGTLEQLLDAESREANSIFSDLECTILNHQGEMATFARELRERFHASVEHSSAMSKFIVGLIDQFVEESCQLQAHADQAHEFQTKTLAEFQKAYEEQSRIEAEQLVADVTNLVSNHISRQKKLVDVRLVGLRDAVTENKAFLVNHSSRMEGVTSEAKRKWHTFSMQAENDAKNGADFSASKHCRMEAFLQKCIATVDNASKHWKRTCESVNDISSKHVKDMESHVRGAIESNDRHDDEIGSARDTAEQDVAESSGDILCHFDRLTEQERESVSGIIQAVEAHTGTLQKLQESHLACAAEMEQRAKDTFEDRYMDYEPSGTTPTRCDLDVPSKVVIESLRAMPMDTLLEEFRENHPYGSAEKEPKPSLIPRSPLIQLN